MKLRSTRALVGGLALAALAAPAAYAEPTPVTTTATTTATATGTASPTGTTATRTTATGTTTTSSVPTTTTTSTGATTSAATTGTATTSPTATRGVVDGGTTRVFGPAAAAGTTASPSPEEAAGGYLARQLAAGGNHFSTWGYPDWGLSADAVLGLDAAGVGQDQAAATTAALAAHVKDYITGEAYGDAGSAYAGATAKTLNVAVAQGVDPTAFGGVDLVATLRSLELASGQFADKSAWGDYSNVFGQSFALIGLHRAGVAPSAASVSFLTAQQCADGGFRLGFGGATCTSDPDATAMAAQALIAVDGAVSAAASRALDFLAGRQAASGGLGGGGPQAGLNANTTGLAGQAFVAGGRTTQARLAASFLTGLQYGCSFPTALRGGIAYDRAAYDTQAAAGTAAVPDDQDRRSTSQAVLALAGTPLYSVTATGASAGSPVVACAAPTTTAVPTTTTTTTTSTTSATSAAVTTTGSTTATPEATTTDEPLAYTGTPALPLGLLGLGLLAGGAALVVLSRRRGTHA